MDFDKINQERRSCRSFDQSVFLQKKEIEEILTDAVLAPSAYNRQPWRFVVLNDEKKIYQLRKRIENIVRDIIISNEALDFFNSQEVINRRSKMMEKGEDSIFYNASTLIFIIQTSDLDFDEISCGMMMQNLLLSAKNKGYDSCVIGMIARLVKEKDFFDQFLNLGEGEKFFCAVAIGKAKWEMKKIERKKNITFL